MSEREGTVWLRTAVVAERLGVSPSQVQILIRTGALKAKRHSPSPRGMYLVAEDECNRYLAASSDPGQLAEQAA